MRHKRLQLSALFLLGLGLTGLQAQTMFVRQSNNTQTEYALSDVQKITFESGNLTVQNMDNITEEYALSELMYLNFTDYETDISETTTDITERLHIYPNPVKNVLNIDLSDVSIVQGTISIINLEGKLLQTKQIMDSEIISLDVSHLPRGIYICRYSNSEEIKTVKIIKQ